MPGAALGLAAAVALLSPALMSPPARAAEPGLSVEGAWLRIVVPSRPAAGYFTLRNAGDAAASLSGAQSPACGQVMLHRSRHEGGQDRMEMVDAVPVPAHGTLVFAPGGYHLMCLQPGPAVRPGGSVPVTLQFGDGGTLSAAFPVRGVGEHG